MNEPLEIDRCFTLAELLLAQDDEPSSSDAAAVRDHVRRCTRCRTRQQWGRINVGEYYSIEGESSPIAAREREIAFQQHLDDQVRRHARIHARAARWTRARWLPLAAAILIALVLTAPYWPSSTLEAEELLERAALSERSRPAGWTQKVRMRATKTGTPRASMTHATTRFVTFAAEGEIGDGLTFDLAAAGRTTRETDALLASLFARHHLDLREPLSIARIRAWRATLRHKRETVTPIDDDTTRLRITTDEGDLNEVDVVVQNVSLGVVNQTLVFRNVGKVEIATQGQPEVRTRPVTQTASGYKAAAAPITPPPMVPPAMSEVRPIEPPPLFGGAAIPQAALSRWLETTFGSDEEKRARFVRDLVERVRWVKRDLYTLQHLAQRVPPVAPDGAAGVASAAGVAATPEQAEAVRAELQRQVARQVRDLKAHLDALATSMAMFGTTSRALPRTQVPANWRHRTTEAMAQLDRFESQLADLLKQEDLTRARDEQGGLLPHPVSETFGALWDAWHAPREP